MISWKHSFKRLNEESEIAKKKRQALDGLLSTGRISQSTHELFNREIDETIAEIERQRDTLLTKMNSKKKELEEQIQILETLLANSEIQHVIGEVSEEDYQREIELLFVGLETARRDLNDINEAAYRLSGGNAGVEEQEEKQSAREEAPQSVAKIVEETAPSQTPERENETSQQPNESQAT